MQSRNLLVVAVWAAILGIALGGSYVWAFLDSRYPPTHRHQASAKEEKPNDQPVNEAEEAIAEYTFWLMLFTGLLFFATVGLGAATAGLYLTGEKQASVALQTANAAALSAEHIPRVERAYLTGGGPVLTDAIRGRLFRIEVENHGKTPAYLCAYDVHFATLEDVREGPQEVFPMRLYDDRIKPGGSLKPLNWIPFTRQDAEIIYGALWYQDLLKREHIFRFILRVDPKRDFTHVGVAGVDDSYTYWD